MFFLFYVFCFFFVLHWFNETKCARCPLGLQIITEQWIVQCEWNIGLILVYPASFEFLWKKAGLWIWCLNMAGSSTGVSRTEWGFFPPDEKNTIGCRMKPNWEVRRILSYKSERVWGLKSKLELQSRWKGYCIELLEIRIRDESNSYKKNKKQKTENRK